MLASRRHFQSRPPADDGAAAIVAQYVEAAAGAHAHNGGLPRRDLLQGGDAGIKAGHQFVNLLLQAEQGGDDGGVLPHALYNAKFGIGGQIDYRGDFTEGIVTGSQPAADEITSGSQAMTASRSASLMVPRLAMSSVM